MNKKKRIDDDIRSVVSSKSYVSDISSISSRPKPKKKVLEKDAGIIDRAIKEEGWDKLPLNSRISYKCHTNSGVKHFKSAFIVEHNENRGGKYIKVRVGPNTFNLYLSKIIEIRILNLPKYALTKPTETVQGNLERIEKKIDTLVKR